MKKIIISSLFIFITSVLVAQQQVQVSGVVYDKSIPDEPLVGVTIYIKNQPGIGVQTDKDGKFSIEVPEGEKLCFSYLGYKTQERLINADQTELKIYLEESAEKLDEAVVVAMGTQRKVSVVGAISSVDIKELRAPATSINNVLGGRVPGVISVQHSGEPGKNISEFWIRGIGTFGANASALVLIDGLEGNLSDIDASDIESFSVLKDASATAVYGVRGANGVILVTTKHGSEGRLALTARVNMAVSKLTRMPKYLRAYDYAKLANEARLVSYQTLLYTPMEMDLIKYGLDKDLYPDVNWQKEVLNPTSFQQTYYISARGGGNIARYFISLNTSLESSAYKQDPDTRYKSSVGYNTYGYRTNLDVNITKTTQVYFGIDGFISRKNEPGMANTDAIWTAQRILTPLTIPTRFSSGELPAYNAENAYSPYVMLNYTGTHFTEEYKNMATIALTQDLSMLVKGLKVRAQGALHSNIVNSETRRIMPNLYAATGRSLTGELQLVKKVNEQAVTFIGTNSHWRKYHFETNITYDRTVGENHRFSGLVYYYMSDEKDTKAKTSMDAIPKRYQGLSGRVTYGYRDTYLLDLNFGYTGSENFQPGRQFGFFPSVALGWVLSNYEFVKEKMPWLNFLKIRGSYGTVGNDRISKTRFPYLTIIDSEASQGWGASGYGLAESVIGADNLVWERAIKADIGIEGRLFNNKLTFVLDFFNDQRSGIFQRRTQIPDYVGVITMPYGNVGSMRSYGADGNIAFTQSLGKDFYLTMRGNFTYSANDIQTWEQAYPEYDYQKFQGLPYGVERGYIALGLFKDEQDVQNSPKQFGIVRPGDIKYKDVNGDGRITSDDKVPLAYGNFPRLMYGFGIELNWRNITLGAMFRGTGRTDFFHVGTGYEMGYIPFHGEKTGNILTIVADQKNRWTPAWYSGDPSTENPHAMFPRLSYGYNDNNSQLSTFWQDNSSYLRLQEVSINYNLQAKGFLKEAGVSSLDFQLIGYDLAVWSKVKMFNPEQAYKNGSAYPIPARFAAQIYVNF